jgi:hypothetical protein
MSFICAFSDPSSQESEEMICESGECYPKEFQPTSEFQNIQPGQVVPPGLHIKLDVQTGEKQAKLSVDTASENGLGVVPGQEAVVVEPPVEESEPKLAHISKLSARERDSFGDFIKDLNVKAPASVCLEILNKLEDMVMHILH